MNTSARTTPCAGRALALLGLSWAAGCGSASYVMSDQDHSAALAQPRSYPVLAASAEPSGAPVRVQRRRMDLERALPLVGGQVRVRPRRPLGLLIAGSLTLGVGVAITGAGIGIIPCPAGSYCENGIAVGALLGVGVPHLLVGTILASIGAARWSPETSGPEGR